MFKEITRKLYGEESTHGLYPHNTQVAQLASTAGPTIPEGERSFTTLVSDRSLAQLDYDNAVDTTFKTEDHLSTAFGLAALMQNGFPPPGAILNPVNFNMSNSSNKQSTAASKLSLIGMLVIRNLITYIIYQHYQVYKVTQMSVGHKQTIS